MRRALALSALAVIAFAPMTSAAPMAEPQSGSATQFRIITRSGPYTISLLASSPTTGGAAALRVRLESSSGQVTRFVGALPASSLVTSGGVTTLRTRVGSVPLSVVFRPESPVVTVGFGNLESDDEKTSGWVIAGNGGTADVTLGGMRCTVTLMATGSATVLDSGSSGRGLAGGLGLPLKGARCSDLPSEPLPVP